MLYIFEGFSVKWYLQSLIVKYAIKYLVEKALKFVENVLLKMVVQKPYQRYVNNVER